MLKSFTGAGKNSNTHGAHSVVKVAGDGLCWTRAQLTSLWGRIATNEETVQHARRALTLLLRLSAGVGAAYDGGEAQLLRDISAAFDALDSAQDQDISWQQASSVGDVIDFAWDGQLGDLLVLALGTVLSVTVTVHRHGHRAQRLPWLPTASQQQPPADARHITVKYNGSHYDAITGIFGV